MKAKYKHIHFEKVDPNLGLGILWECYNNETADLLCIVPEEKTWGQYVTESIAGIQLSGSCHKDITNFLEQLNP